MLALENIHDLEIARAASEQGSFSGAARVLDITQPAVSQAIARLERQLGVTLFDRQESGHAAFLTDAGAVLLAHGITALDELQEALSDLATLRGSRHLAIGLPAALARHYFPEGLDTLTGAQHVCSVEITLHDSEHLLDELRRRKVDAGMLASSSVGVSVVHATCTKVASYPLMLALRESDRPATKHLSIAALARAEAPFVAFSGDRSLREALSAQMAARGCQLDVVAETDQSEMLYQLVAAGMGVGISSALELEHAPAGIALVPLSDADLPTLNVFVFEDAVRARGPEHDAFAAIRRQLFAAVRERAGEAHASV